MSKYQQFLTIYIQNFMLSEFIQECLKPLCIFQWLKEIYVEPELYNNILFWVAYNDKRLMI